MRRQLSPFAFPVAALMVLIGGQKAEAKEAYSPNWESLARHKEAPEWFRDAKFGIYFHWGPYCVPAYGTEWYPRNMHIKGNREFEHHLQTYGHPSEFGYHDFVPLFKAEHFDPEEWAELFAQSGARFAGPVAEHHDGFAMWDSQITPWNAADRGPRRDVTGELAKAIRDRGMKFVVTFHHARNLQRHADSSEQKPFRDSHYPYISGMPPASDDPDLRLLYGNLPEQEWLEDVWLAKLKEVIDQYQPDLIWFDSWLNKIPEDYRQEFCAYYLNRADEWGKQVVITRKQNDLPLSVSLEDYEKGRLDELTDRAWLTDDTISQGSWCYTKDLRIKPARMVLHGFIDLVSKNGQLLLNISPKADGTIPQDQRAVLEEMGKWLKLNGEAIYATRPWTQYGEGPTTIGKSGHFIREPTYTAEDIRFTRSKDGDTLYAILLGWPESESIAIKSLASAQPASVQMLGAKGELNWESSPNGLSVELPENPPCEHAFVLRLKFGKSIATASSNADP